MHEVYIRTYYIFDSCTCRDLDHTYTLYYLPLSVCLILHMHGVFESEI